MDLEAYAQIEDLEKIANENNIEVPRLRGYRLMKDESPVTTDTMRKIMHRYEIDVCENLCCSEPFWHANANCYTFSSYTDYLRHYYLIESVDEDGYKRYTGIRWDRIHGWKRKVLKFAIKQKKKQIQKEIAMWNKYAGNEKVLYIHARIGGPNWNAYGGNEISKLPWFLDKVDDYYDNTYCNIYALIK